jgi:uncharacterized protein YbjT (DUF2867 family)
MTVLVVGATGSVGRLAVSESFEAGHTVRPLTRRPEGGRRLPDRTDVVIGDVTRPDTLAAAVDGIDAIIFTHGSDGTKAGSEAVDYGAVSNILEALGGRPVRIALMTAIGVTNRTGSYNRRTEAHDWKRRAERLVRASGNAYTIVRPGWFDYNGPDEHKLVLLQGDTRQAGDSSDGVIARAQIAQILVASLTSPSAVGKTFELVAERGAAQTNLDVLFARIVANDPASRDGVEDKANMPIEDEPRSVRDALAGYVEAR